MRSGNYNPLKTGVIGMVRLTPRKRRPILLCYENAHYSAGFPGCEFDKGANRADGRGIQNRAESSQDRSLNTAIEAEHSQRDQRQCYLQRHPRPSRKDGQSAAIDKSVRSGQLWQWRGQFGPRYCHRQSQWIEILFNWLLGHEASTTARRAKVQGFAWLRRQAGWRSARRRAISVPPRLWPMIFRRCPIESGIPRVRNL